MFIETELTPNPAVIKFLLGETILETGSLHFTSMAQAGRSPLAQRLFGLAGVKGVFLGKDFVSVTKDNATDWTMLKPLILAGLMEHMAMKHPILFEVDNAAGAASAAPPEDEDEISMQVRQLLEERVRPAVAQDGGDIVFERFEDGVVYVQLQGACAGCPSATMTLKSGVENMLRHFIPEVQEVRPVNF